MNGGTHIAQEDLALYAMGDLRDEELKRVRDHLQHCAECSEEARAIAEDVAAIGMSVEQQTVPARARQRLLDSIAADAVPVAVSRVEKAVTPMAKRSAAAVWVPWTIAAALAIGAAGLGVKMNSLQQQLREQSRTLAQSQEQGLRSARVLELLKAPNAQRATLTAAKKPVEPAGHAVYLAERGELIFQGSNLKALPAGKAYELWVIPANGNAPIPAGVFRPDGSGEASVVMPPLPTGVPAKAFAITVERAEGVAKPEGAIVLSGETAPGA
jgi:hypothetical protein